MPGYYGNTTRDMKMEALFITASKVLEAFAACRPSNQSFIRTPRVGAATFHLLPSSVLVTFEADDEERDRLVAEFPTVGPPDRCRGGTDCLGRLDVHRPLAKTRSNSGEFQ
jgi:hypothetical protein